MTPPFNKPEFLTSNDAFAVLSLVRYGPMVLEKKRHGQMDERTMDNNVKKVIRAFTSAETKTELKNK